jgi:hypothetical protein
LDKSIKVTSDIKRFFSFLFFLKFRQGTYTSPTTNGEITPYIARKMYAQFGLVSDANE